jgi:hypothetical protein
MEDTIRYLSVMHGVLKDGLELSDGSASARACTNAKCNVIGRAGVSDGVMTPADLDALTKKRSTLTASAVFGKQLRQVRGCSGDRATAVLAKYPTPMSLYQAYLDLPDEKKRENLLADLRIGEGKRLGPALSKLIYQTVYLSE